MKIVVIGSEGFIGSHCVGYFSDCGHEMYGVDLVEQSSMDYHYKKVFPQEVKHEDLFKTIQPDICIYASGSANVNLSILNPVSDFEANSVYIFHLLNTIKLYCPECKFVNISSAAVYGNPKSLPVKEDSVINPISPYGWHKYYSELICKEFSVLYGIKTVSIRPFSVFGPRQKKLLFWDIYKKSFNETIELFGTGKETRDFIYVEDLCLAIDCIINKAEMKSEVYNIGLGKQTNIREAGELFVNILETEKIIRFNNIEKSGDPLYWQADIEALNDLGFIPKFDLASGLKNYVSWLKESA